MKIAYVHNGFWPSQSPCFIFTTMTALALAEHTEKTYFFIRKNSSKSPSEVISKNFGLSLPPNLNIYPISTSRILKAHKFYYEKIYKTLKELKRKKELDAVFSRNTTFLPYLIKLKKNLGLPVYFESHDFFADLSIRDDVDKKRKREMRLEKKYLDQLTGLICLHRTQKEVYQKYFPDLKIFIARTGLIPTTGEYSVSKKYLGYIGSLDKHKGVVQIFKAAALSKTKPPILIVGGKSIDEIDQFRSYAKKYYLPEKVTISGWVDKIKMKSYLAEIKVGILPLEDTFFNRYLTSPLKLFDFYSYNIPVIAPDFPTLRELIPSGKSGLFYDSHKISEMAAAIDKLFSDQDLYFTIKNYINNYKKGLAWSKRAAILIDSMRPDINE